MRFGNRRSFYTTVEVSISLTRELNSGAIFCGRHLVVFILDGVKLASLAFFRSEKSRLILIQFKT